jgi:hypothetical protein
MKGPSGHCHPLPGLLQHGAPRRRVSRLRQGAPFFTVFFEASAPNQQWLADLTQTGVSRGLGGGCADPPQEVCTILGVDAAAHAGSQPTQVERT